MSENKLIRFDWAMKTILRDKSNFDVLEGFLAALLGDDDIKILALLESEGNQQAEDDKFNRVDLIVQDKEGRKIYIEIQNTRETAYLKRLLYASSKIIVDNQKLGEDFLEVSKVISVSIMYFSLGTGDDYIYRGANEFIGMNTGNRLILKQKEWLAGSPEPKYHFVERDIFPEYYLISVDRYPNTFQKKVDEWIYMFKNNEVAAGSVSKNIDKAAQKLAEINMDPDERRVYEKFLINTARDRDAIDTAKTEGMVAGKAEGKAEGKIEAALNGIKAGFSNEIIAAITGLSPDEINKLRDQTAGKQN